MNSPTLHERLAKATHEYPGAGLRISFNNLTPDALRAIEAAIRAEATDPLRNETYRLRHEIACLQQDREDLRAENAALRQAGDALREIAWLHYDDRASMGHLAAAIEDYDDATTTRAEETKGAGK